MNLFQYENIGPEILQSFKFERKMASLLVQKFKSKECGGFVYKKHKSTAAYMIPLTFAYILYSLYILCTKSIQRQFQLANCIGFA